MPEASGYRSSGTFAISQISMVEVPGYHRLAEDERGDLGNLLAASTIVPFTEAAADRAIALRQRQNMGLPDALIAATALEGD